MLQTTLRLIASLAVVVGLMILLARVASRRMRGGHGSLVRVLHRQPLTRGSGVAVVEVGGRMLVLGTTEQQVSLLTELDPFEVMLHDESSGETVALATASALHPFAADGTDVAAVSSPSRACGGSHRAARPVAQGSALSGSILAPATWRQAVAAMTGRAS
ncbi:MAG: FliO/MopB family protein [Marmoricola sp.]